MFGNKKLKEKIELLNKHIRTKEKELSIVLEDRNILYDEFIALKNVNVSLKQENTSLKSQSQELTKEINCLKNQKIEMEERIQSMSQANICTCVGCNCDKPKKTEEEIKQEVKETKKPTNTKSRSKNPIQKNIN